ncbi:MAG: tail fiber protein [Planctomycetes bacterium]|nr:tail fiber protein [Planctomycetota bacterium]
MFALVGTIYGGNGRTTFKFPYLRKSGESLRAAAGIDKKKPGLAYVIARFGIFPSRN